MARGEMGGLTADEGGGTNRLAGEKSPYLLQHADNPVDWYPWGEEAFERARSEDKPIFLSIGYSTCHWCHVMAHESFEDGRVAEMMNEGFVNIKVDREERPDIDSIYMTVCQMMTGGGGWPLTIVMTPDGEPFFAGTYFPREGRFGRAGMLELVPQLRQVWDERREEVLASASEISTALSEQTGGSAGDGMDERFLNTAAMQLNQRFDEENGGFGSAPKFPSPHQLLFLLRFWRRADDGYSLRMVQRTLRAMRMGGVYDQVGFGFHRYSTDARWLLPHFEKMLYDQAMLVMAYTEGHQATGDPSLRATALEVAEYVLRDMTSPEGAFYSAEDADSEGVEGRFYVWTADELRQVLGEEDAEVASRVWNAEEAGNFREEATGEATGANVLHLTRSIEELAADLGASPAELEERVEGIRGRLLEARSRRVRPHLDDKVLADWNGLMVAALAKAGAALDRPDLVDAARRAADFVLDNMRTEGGRLLHRYRDGEAAVAGQLDDYAFVVWGLLELYEATFESRHLVEAMRLNDAMLEHFWDGEGGGLFLTPDDGEELLVRPKEAYDGALPSGNSVAMLNLLRLGLIAADPSHTARANGIAVAFSGDVGRAPVGFTQMMVALDLALGGGRTVVVVGERGAEDTRDLLAALRSRFAPNKVLLFRTPGECDAGTLECAPFLKDYGGREGQATAYVCQADMCRPPTGDVDVVMGYLDA